jgi:hypothetical protein
MEDQEKYYDKPAIITYTEEEIAGIIGPAHTVTSGGPPGIEYP